MYFFGDVETKLAILEFKIYMKYQPRRNQKENHMHEWVKDGPKEGQEE